MCFEASRLTINNNFTKTNPLVSDIIQYTYYLQDKTVDHELMYSVRTPPITINKDTLYGDKNYWWKGLYYPIKNK